MSQRWFLGLFSGESLAGVDAALVESSGVGEDWRCRLVHFVQLPFARDLREWLLRAASGNTLSARQVALLHRYVGETFAMAARAVAEQARFSLERVFCAGFSGHTIWHDHEARYSATLPLGMADVIAERTGMTVVSDFRGRDMLASGIGFPVTALVDYLLFHDSRENRVLLDLGSVATMVYLPRTGGPQHVIGFQAAPCTLLLDGLMSLMTGGREPYDAGGKHAVQGCCIDGLLKKWLAHPLLQKKPPRAFLRQDFGEEFVHQAAQHARDQNRNLHDLLCTANHFVTEAIVEAMHRFLPELPQRIVLSGGGVRNGFLWRLLEEKFKRISLEKSDVHGIPADARQAAGYAGLAALALDGIPASLPAVTGATGSRLLGHFTPGSFRNWARCLTWMANQASPLKAAA